ncbi:hypothetical protein PHMEG_00016238 [Phytophthora megakarya]|uniref:Reverse transcriptase n=1 Tax=Phytophthora megakarya TaxID=4795 RepID=A0A225VZG7_9STRA|nr:hypothetical protein PHMEG_00016238 [Phytophthora megakarya]
MRAAEDLAKSQKEHNAEHSAMPWGEPPMAKTKFAAARNGVENQDPVSKLVNDPTSDMFVKSMNEHSCRSSTGGKSFDDCLATLDRLLIRFTEYRISISFTKTIFVQPRVEFLFHEVSHEEIRANAKKLAAKSLMYRFHAQREGRNPS